MMNDSQGPQGRSQKSHDCGIRIAFRLTGCLAVGLLLHGCGTPQPASSSPAESSTVAVTAAPTRIDVSPSVTEEEVIKPVPEDSNIFVPLRSTTVDDAGKEKLRRHADRLKLNPMETVSLVGYTDDQGSRNYNLAITEERLLVVEKLLKSYRVPARQIRRKRISGLKNSPACKTDRCRQQMRRVELVFSLK